VRKRPSAAAVKILYASAPWAADREPAKISAAVKNSPLLATAWEGKRLVGMARCSTDFVFRCVLWDVIVDPEYRQRGLGKKLVRLITAHPRLKAVDQFWLYTSANETFYASLGFKRQSRGVMVSRKKRR
jgi:ribosomal protein S18 acetylase RimI-like enzyme